MHCGGCLSRVQQAATKLAPGTTVTLDPPRMTLPRRRRARRGRDQRRADPAWRLQGEGAGRSLTEETALDASEQPARAVIPGLREAKSPEPITSVRTREVEPRHA